MQVETKTVDLDVVGALSVVSRYRFQLDNHLGSASLEVDESGLVIGYEEYHPYGTTAYASGRGGVEVSGKRYRYTGKERDEETGLYYHGARHMAPWLGRWTSADPAGMVDGPGLYTYVRGNPVALSDPSGTTGDDQVGITNFEAAAAKLATSSDPNEQRWVVDGPYEPSATSVFDVPDRPGSIAASSTASGKGAKPPADGEPSVSISKLRQISAALQPHLTYAKPVMRAMGVVQAAGGLLEVGGAGVAFASPDPVATKIAGGFMLAHGVDQLATGVQMIWTGESQHTYTFKIAAGTARSFGADQGWQNAAGQSADVAANALSIGISLRLATAPLQASELATVSVKTTGARTLTGLDWDAAEGAYDTIRATDDVGPIAANTGMRESWIARVKDHLFFQTHQLDAGVARFDADPFIANAWGRLQSGTHTANDIALLRHELFESRFEAIFGTNYVTAHNAALSAGRTWEWSP